MKRLVCFIAALILLAAGTALAGQDIQGWGKVKWGMPCAEVQRLYPGKWMPKLKNAPPRWNANVLPVIQGKEFKPLFWFLSKSPSAKLKKVTMVSEGKPGDYKAILGLLTGKYGKPDKFNYDKLMDSNHWVWFRKSGQLEFALLEIKNIALCTLTYVGVSKESDNL